MISEHTTLKRLHQLFATINVPSDTRKPVLIICYLKALKETPTS